MAAVGYIIPNPFEPYRISGTPFAAAAFVGAFGHGADDPYTSSIAAMYETLGGTGFIFGEVNVEPGMGGGDVVIKLNGLGIMGLNLFAGSHFVIGGRLTDITPDAPRTPSSEWIFLYSDVGSTSTITGFKIPFHRLGITMIPEPNRLSFP